jgi:hypothetical protein
MEEEGVAVVIPRGWCSEEAANILWSGAGMEELLLEAANGLGATILIISDANSVFIEHILTIRNLSHVVRE